jgi:hypothetical protein
MLRNVLEVNITLFADVIKTDSKINLAGVTWDDITRRIMYEQMMVPLQASMLANKVSGVYLQVHNAYIVPAQKTVSGMLRFNHEDTEEGERKFKGKLAGERPDTFRLTTLAQRLCSVIS